MKEKTICRGDLFYYDFGTRTGSVQSGTRPVLVIQADDYNRNAPTIIVAAVTGVIKKDTCRHISCSVRSLDSRSRQWFYWSNFRQ